MRFRTVTAVCLLVVLFVVLGGGRAEAQAFRVEVGAGWAFSSSEVNAPVQDVQGTARIDPGSGPNTYAAAGLIWTLSDALSLEGRLRAQQSQLRVGSGDISPGVCVDSCPTGRLRALSFEGQLRFTSIGRISPYVLVSLGVVRTTFDAARIDVGGTEFQLSDVAVTDAGGDVGLGAALRLVEGLSVTMETRVTGSLPGGKENFVTTFPFTLGLSYTVGKE